MFSLTFIKVMVGLWTANKFLVGLWSTNKVSKEVNLWSTKVVNLIRLCASVLKQNFLINFLFFTTWLEVLWRFELKLSEGLEHQINCSPHREAIVELKVSDLDQSGACSQIRSKNFYKH